MDLTKKNVLLLILGTVPLFIVAATLKFYPGNVFAYGHGLDGMGPTNP